MLDAAGERAGTMVCVPDEHGLRFDITLQGEEETVFLSFPGHGAAGSEGTLGE